MNFGIEVLDELCKLCGVSSLKINIIYMTMRISSVIRFSCNILI